MNVRKIIKEEMDDFDWVSQHLETVPDEPEILVLKNCYGIEVIQDIEEKEWNHYGLKTYSNYDGESYAVGTESEFIDALRDYWYNFPDDVGVENVYNYEQYLTMSDYDRESFASEMADSYVDDLSDEECIEREGFDESYEELNEKMEELDDEYYDIEDDVEREEQIKEEKRELQKEIDNLIERARQFARDSEYDEWYDCLGDPIDCLIRIHGFYSSVEDLTNSGLLDFDLDEFADDMVNQGSYGDLSSYDGEYCEDTVDGVRYISIRVD